MAGAKVNIAEATQGQTPLMYAAVENHAAAVKVLVEAGADVNAKSKPLEWPEFKFNTGGMIYTLQPVGGWTAAMYAAREGAIDAVRALADAKADLNLADPDGTTPLILAIVNGKFDTAVALLDKGANPNAVDQMGMSALYAAVDMHTLSPMMGRPAPAMRDSIDAVEMARALLRKGANPNLQLKKPIIGRHTAFQGDGQLGEGTTPLARAAKSADAAMIKVLLDGGADPRLTQKDGTTVAMIATNARGQRVYAAAASVGTPATEADALAALTLLLNTPLDVNAANANGQTALHNAAARGSDPIVKLLLEKGAKLDAKDRLGRLPIDMARGAGGGGGRGRGNAAGQVHESTTALLTEAMTSRGIADTAAGRPDGAHRRRTRRSSNDARPPPAGARGGLRWPARARRARLHLADRRWAQSPRPGSSRRHPPSRRSGAASTARHRPGADCWNTGVPASTATVRA